MSFATHRMRPPDPVISTLAPLKLAATEPTAYFSNSGLVDYKHGISLPVSSSVTPPAGPSTDPPTQLLVEMKALPTPAHNEPLTAEQAAAQFAQQFIKKTSAKAMDPDMLKMHAEFQVLSGDGVLPTFEQWIGADTNRKLMLKAGAENILFEQYQDIVHESGWMSDLYQKATDKMKKAKETMNVVGEAAHKAYKEHKKKSAELEESENSEPETSKQPAKTGLPINSRLTAVENQMKHLVVGMDNHTFHLRQLKEGMQNHTEVLQHTVTGLHNHTDVLNKTVSGMHNHTEVLKKTVSGMHNHTEVLNKTVSGMHNHTAKLRELAAKPVTSTALMSNHRQRMGSTGRSVLTAADLLADY